MVQLRAIVLMACATYVASGLGLVALLFASQVLAPDLFQPVPVLVQPGSPAEQAALLAGAQ